MESIGSVDALREHTRSTNKYFIMRHGEAESNVKGIVSYKPEDEFHLTEKGKTQSKGAGSTLVKNKIDLIIASPLLRTKETAEIAAEALGIAKSEIIYDARIGEVNTGDFNGCAIETYRTFFSSTIEKFTKPSPNGENLETMKARIGEFLYEIDKTHKGKNVLIVTHEYVTWLADAVAKGSTNEEASTLRDGEGEDYINNAEVRPFQFAPIPHNDKYELDFHRPHVDNVAFHCSCELGTMERIPEVFDCWFESGSMPFAQFHYMGDERTPEGKLFVKNFPADFIAEAVDQTRGWFYTMLILSVALFDRAAFKSVITTGLILAEDGQKMSKRLKNYPDPLELAAKYGADALRFYMTNSPVVRGEELRFALSGVDEVFKKITLRTDNVRTFLEMYLPGVTISRVTPSSPHTLDRWILARWYEMHAEVTHHLDTHELDKATRPIMPFIDDLSTWYLRRSRDRFKGDDRADVTSAIQTTGWILLQLSKLLAPFMPFLAEDLYQRLPIEGKKESVHLEDWSEVGVAASSILDNMDVARKVVEVALFIRAQNNLKVRQPLSALTYQLPAKHPPLSEEVLAIIRDEVNVKTVAYDEEIKVTAENDLNLKMIEAGGVSVALDIALTDELREEGMFRDVVRTIQEKRKKLDLVPSDRILLTLGGDKDAITLVTKYASELEKLANVATIEEGSKEESDTLVLGTATLRFEVRKV